jgi:isopentenyl phosphate kinase
MKRLVVIKFGGGIVTDKESPLTARPAALMQLVHGFAGIRKAMPDTHFLLGNGAGSFGHFTAHQYGLRDGAHTPDQFYGMAVTHMGVQKLNTMITEVLLEEKVPAFSLTPSSFMFCDNGKVTTTHTEPLMQLMQDGCVPLVFGDTIVDKTRGTTILSTEKVLHACLEALRASFDHITVVYMFGADGVLDSQGNTIAELPADMSITELRTNAPDVTGGITGKITAARAASKVADDVYLIGKDPSDLETVLAGKPAGTRILA